MARLVESSSNQRALSVAAEFLRQHDESLVIAPTRAAADELARAAHERGSLGVHRMTLMQLAAALAQPAMAEHDLAPLGRLSQQALAARVAHAALEELKYFKPVAAMPGFARALAATLTDLRLEAVSAARLRDSGPAGQDLARLLELYARELEERRLCDLFGLIALAAPVSEHRLLGLPLVLLDVPVPSLPHLALLRTVVGRAPAVFAAVCRGDEDCRKRYETLLGVPTESLDSGAAVSRLEHLRRYLFQPEVVPAGITDASFEQFSAPGEGLEAVEIARRILKLGLPFDQIAILLRSSERYQPMIEEALRRARIPAYFSRGAVRPDPAGRAFLALLACAAEGCSASRFAEYLSLGQVPSGERAPGWFPPDDEMVGDFRPPEPPPEELEDAEPADPDGAVVHGSLRAPSAWEKLLVDAAVIGGRDRWMRRLHGLEQELSLQLAALARDDETRRAHLARQIELLANLERFALPVIDFLGDLPKSAPWGQWLPRLDMLARMTLGRPESVLAMLAELEPMAEVGPVGLEEVSEVLSERLRFLRSEPPLRRYGRVFVGSIEEARGRAFQAVFLPGLAEGLFPRRAFEDALLLDEARCALDSGLATRDDKVAQERLLLHIAAAAGERLIASYPRMDVAQARPRVPSFYALELPRAVEGRLPELEAFERQARAGGQARLNWPAPRDPDDAIDDAEYDLAALEPPAPGIGHYLVEVNPALARSLRARWRRWSQRKWNFADGIVEPDQHALAALAQHRLAARAYSPTALQQYAVCPYRFALHAIHRLRVREEKAPLEQMDPLTRGALFHEVQFALFRELEQQKLLPVAPARLKPILDVADQVLGRVAMEYEEKLAPAIPRVWQTEIEDLRTDLRGWLQQVALDDAGWQPLHFEFAFGLERSEQHDRASRAEEVLLFDRVRLRGSIDLVERHAGRGVLRVTDHKTGKPPEQPPAYVGGGVFLQPLLYGLAAEKLLGQTVEAGRLFYATQRGGYSSIVVPVTPQSRQFLAVLLHTVDQAIGEGFLPAAPQKDACEYCDYRPVCGPYEQQRVARKDPDPLDPLIAIRNMP